MPCSVPTRYLVGPASWLYSIELPPRTIPPPLESVASCNVSVGSPNRRVSHHIIWPSVDTDAHWLPVTKIGLKISSDQVQCFDTVVELADIDDGSAKNVCVCRIRYGRHVVYLRISCTILLYVGKRSSAFAAGVASGLFNMY